MEHKTPSIKKQNHGTVTIKKAFESFGFILLLLASTTSLGYASKAEASELNVTTEKSNIISSNMEAHTVEGKTKTLLDLGVGVDIKVPVVGEVVLEIEIGNPSSEEGQPSEGDTGSDSPAGGDSGSGSPAGGDFGS
ncbi:hypothetical protein, partial [Domibacillus epiphyticus]